MPSCVSVFLTEHTFIEIKDGVFVNESSQLLTKSKQVPDDEQNNQYSSTVSKPACQIKFETRPKFY